jgi:effector-binding domain-containing protein
LKIMKISQAAIDAARKASIEFFKNNKDPISHKTTMGECEAMVKAAAPHIIWANKQASYFAACSNEGHRGNVYHIFEDRTCSERIIGEYATLAEAEARIKELMEKTNV